MYKFILLSNVFKAGHHRKTVYPCALLAKLFETKIFQTKVVEYEILPVYQFKKKILCVL